MCFGGAPSVFSFLGRRFCCWLAELGFGRFHWGLLGEGGWRWSCHGYGDVSRQLGLVLLLCRHVFLLEFLEFQIQFVVFLLQGLEFGIDAHALGVNGLEEFFSPFGDIRQGGDFGLNGLDLGAQGLVFRDECLGFVTEVFRVALGDLGIALQEFYQFREAFERSFGVGRFFEDGGLGGCLKFFLESNNVIRLERLFLDRAQAASDLLQFRLGLLALVGNGLEFGGEISLEGCLSRSSRGIGIIVCRGGSRISAADEESNAGDNGEPSRPHF